MTIYQYKFIKSIECAFFEKSHYWGKCSSYQWWSFNETLYIDYKNRKANLWTKTNFFCGNFWLRSQSAWEVAMTKRIRKKRKKKFPFPRSQIVPIICHNKNNKHYLEALFLGKHSLDLLKLTEINRERKAFSNLFQFETSAVCMQRPGAGVIRVLISHWPIWRVIDVTTWYN